MTSESIGWNTVCLVAGVGLGLFTGDFLNTVRLRWENIDRGTKAFLALSAFLFCGGVGGGAALLKTVLTHGAGGYLAGIGGALVAAYIWPRQLEQKIEKKSVQRAIQVLDAFIRFEALSHNDQVRRLTALITSFPTDLVCSALRISQEQLGVRIGDALDQIPDVGEGFPPTGGA